MPAFREDAGSLAAQGEGGHGNRGLREMVSGGCGLSSQARLSQVHLPLLVQPEPVIEGSQPSSSRQSRLPTTTDFPAKTHCSWLLPELLWIELRLLRGWPQVRKETHLLAQRQSIRLLNPSSQTSHPGLPGAPLPPPALSALGTSQGPHRPVASPSLPLAGWEGSQGSAGASQAA